MVQWASRPFYVVVPYELLKGEDLAPKPSTLVFYFLVPRWWMEQGEGPVGDLHALLNFLRKFCWALLS
jgi:hypothetical protein